jgi:hypothetical protein
MCVVRTLAKRFAGQNDQAKIRVRATATSLKPPAHSGTVA